MTGVTASTRRRRAGRILLVLAVAATAFCAWSWRFLHWRSGLRGFEAVSRSDPFGREFPGLTSDEVLILGHAHGLDRRPASSYLLAEETKAVGTVRVGVFGCSFAEGQEAPDGGDFPSLLDREFERRETGAVEVINFGVYGYGLHQSYLLWQFLAHKYDLDVTVFNLYRFHGDRDNTFIRGNDEYGYVHGRYILDAHGDLKLIRPQGATRAEAAHIYFGFPPDRDYTRYDIKAPPILRALLRPGDVLRNPFYHLENSDGETGRIARRILGEIASRSRRLIVICNDPGLREEIGGDARIEWVDARAPRIVDEQPSLYRAPGGHFSVLGNRIVARELAAAIAGESPVAVPRMFLLPLDGERTASSGIVPAAPGRFQSVRLEIAGQPAGILVERIPGRPAEFLPWQPERVRAAGLLNVSTDADLRFLPIDLDCGGERLTLSFRSSGRAIRIPIGDLDFSGSPLARVASIPNSGSDPDWVLKSPMPRSLSRLEIRGRGEIGDAAILLGDERLLVGRAVRGTDGWRFDWKPERGDLLHVRAHPEQFIDLPSIPLEGAIEISFASSSGETVAVPFAGYRLSGIDPPDSPSSD